LAKSKTTRDSSEDPRRGEDGPPAVNAAREPMNRKDYEKALRDLQVELCALQEWVKHKGLRVVVVFEGRDAAGKGGVIKAITARVSPRVFRVVALPAPLRPREDPALLAALWGPAPGRGRNRDLRPQLVQ
jgi:polyphosphate kinase